VGSKLGASKNYEDEKFAYIAIAKGDVTMHYPPSPFGKLIRAPIKKGGHVIMDYCSPQGTIERGVVPRSRGSDWYKAARKAQWGDGFDVSGMKGGNEKDQD
jgi:ribosomal protein RSM22 (predicted rRNA methylase)